MSVHRTAARRVVAAAARAADAARRALRNIWDSHRRLLLTDPGYAAAIAALAAALASQPEIADLLAALLAGLLAIHHSLRRDDHHAY